MRNSKALGRRHQYGWILIAYYNDTVKPPKKPHDKAIEIWCGTESVKDLELRILNDRTDIGTVNVEQIHAE